MHKPVSDNAVLPLILAVAAGYMWIYRYMTMDDTFIFTQFVRNMLNGEGMSFNASEPTYGFTSALWVAMLYLAGLIGGDLVSAAKAMSFTFALLSIVAFHFLARSTLGTPTYYHAATAAWAVNPIFVNMAFSGMESTLGTFLLISGFLLHSREWKSAKAVVWTPAVFALAYLTRPEFLLLLPLWLGDTWFCSDRQIRLKRLLYGILLYAVPVGIWFAIAWASFGTIVPNPVVIKALRGAVDYDMIYVMKRFILMLGSIHAVDLIIIIGAGLAVAVGMYKRRKIRTRANPVWPDAFLGLWVAGVLLSYLLQHVAVSPRYFLIVSPALTLLAFRGLLALRDLDIVAGRRLPGYFLVLFVIQSAVATSFIYYPHTVTYNEKDKLLKDVAAWLRQHTPGGTAVASVDIGILGYYSDRRIVDQTGLINPDIIYRKSAPEYLRDKNVAYVLDRHPEPGYLANSGRDREWFDYEPVRFLSVPSAGWTAGLTERSTIGFTLYRLQWKNRRDVDICPENEMVAGHKCVAPFRGSRREHFNQNARRLRGAVSVAPAEPVPNV